MRVQRFSGGVEGRQKIFGQAVCRKLTTQGIRAGKNVRDCDSVTLDEALHLWFDDGGGEAGDDGRYATEKSFKDRSCLREVGGFGGASSIGEGGKKIDRKSVV